MTHEEIYEKAFNEGVASALSAKDWAWDFLDGEDHERSPDFVAGFVAGAVETRKDTAKVLLTAAQSIRESTRLVRIAHEKLVAAEEIIAQDIRHHRAHGDNDLTEVDNCWDQLSEVMREAYRAEARLLIKKRWLD